MTNDVLIIGSGASGGMAANTLTKKGIKCLMLDAGPPVDFTRDRDHEARLRASLPRLRPAGAVSARHAGERIHANLWADEKQNPYTYDPDDPYYWVRVRLIGGKTLLWGRASWRLSDYEFKAKDHDGFGDNWPISYKDLAPYYDRVEPMFRVSGRKEGLPQLPDGVFLTMTSPDSRKREALSSRGEAPRYPDNQGSGARPDSSPVPRICLLPDALATGKLTIVPNAVVREITVDTKYRPGERRYLSRPAFAARDACQGASGGRRRVVSRKHAPAAEFGHREFERRAGPLSVRSDLRQERRAGASSRRRATARRHGG